MKRFQHTLLAIATVLLALPTSSLAKRFTQDGLVYETTAQAQEVSLAGYTIAPTGNLSVPATVTNNGTSYRVTAVGNYAFGACQTLTGITLPSQVQTIGNNAFFNCKSLQSVSLPSSLRTIGNEAFYGCTALKSLTVPEQCERIGTRAFACCTGLQTVTIRSAVAEIAPQCFLGDFQLGNVSVPASVQTVGWGAFVDNRQRTTLSLPGKVSQVDSYAFWGCTALGNVTAEATSPSGMGHNVFSDATYTAAPLSVPSGTRTAYSSADEWRRFTTVQETQAGGTTRIACCGASITYGYNTSDPATKSYPAQMGQILGSGYEVGDFGISGCCMLKRGAMPYVRYDGYTRSLQYSPDIVFIDLGGNDAKLENRVYKADFVADATELVTTYQNLPTHPRVILLTAMVGFTNDSTQIWDKAIVRDINPLIYQTALNLGIEVLDMHPVLADRPDLVPDLIHPNDEGSRMLGAKMAQYLKDFPTKPYAGMTVDGKPWDAYRQHNVPGTVEAEQYNTDPSAAYWANGIANGNVKDYRTAQAVSMSRTGDMIFLDYASGGDFTTYTIDMARSAYYDITLHCSEGNEGIVLSLELDGSPLATGIQVENTGWNNFYDLQVKNVYLPAGRHLLRWSTSGSVNLDKFVFEEAYVYNGTPYRGTAAGVPGIVEAEDFDNGGRGVAFQWSDYATASREYRPEDIHVDRGNGGWVLGYTSNGDYTNYTIDVKEEGDYTINVLSSSGNQGNGYFQLAIDNRDVSGTVTVPYNNWDVYSDVAVTGVHLTAGKHVLRFETKGGMNVDRFEFVNNTPTSIAPAAHAEAHTRTTGVYDLTGRCLRTGSNSLDGLAPGIYIVGGHKVVKR